MKSNMTWMGCLVAIGLLSAIPAQAGTWRFPVGLTYISGFSKVSDLYKDELATEGYETSDSTSIPVGLSFAPYYEFDHGSRLGFDLGPAGILIVDRSGWSSDDTSVDYWDVPVALSYGFSFIPKSSVTPYARVGIKYHIVGGDMVNTTSSPGLFGAVGVEFMRNRMIGVGLEAGYDSSEVTFDHLSSSSSHSDYTSSEKIKTGAFLVSLRAIF